jgi:hypothetical protein
MRLANESSLIKFWIGIINDKFIICFLNRITVGRGLVWLRSVKGKGTSTISPLGTNAISRIIIGSRAGIQFAKKSRRGGRDGRECLF